MNKQDWKTLQAAFASAAALSGEERAAFIDEFANAYPHLQQDLHNLLRADEHDDDALVDPIAATAESFAELAADPWLDRQLGHWTITKRIGGGGMGAVFLAERADEQYSQTVAIKVMAAQMLAEDAVLRFRAERQILASLNHPNIAKLIDGGSSDEGLPYLVMEYIEGLPVDIYCDQNRLSIDERLKLLQKVCAAVDYAHRNLVVHRDLKPSNIIVDASGEPKLLDFGIAKLLEAGSYQQTMAVTREGARAMTPEYASPEQVRGEPITVATDVYALGILMYRLLTGASPYGSDASTPREYEAAILESEPLRPSTVVTSTGANVGEQRSSTVAQLSKRLLGDIDNIALKALQKEAQRRYATASFLADDIQRYLNHEPVEARGDDWVYKSKKFAIRNVKSLSITAAVVLTISTLVVFYTLQLADERDRANQAASQANEVSDFLTGLFESASPHQSKGEQITAVDLLREGREQIDALEDQPKLQAELMRVMASSMTALGEFELAIEMLERVLEMKQAQQPQDRISISQTTHNLASANRQSGRLLEAEDYERQTLAIAVEELGADNSNTAYLMSRLGVILFDARRVEEALALEQEALEILMANGDGETASAIDVRGNTANALAFVGRYAEAEQLVREAIALSESVQGELHPNTIIRRSNLGLILQQRGKTDEALALFERCLADAVKVWPENYTQIDSMMALRARALLSLGRINDALLEYQAAVEMVKNRDGEDNLRYISRRHGEAGALLELGQLDAAEAIMNDAIATAASIDKEDAVQVGRIHISLGELEVRRQQLAAAEEHFKVALSHAEQLSSASTLTINIGLADVISKRGRSAEAEALLTQTILAKEATVGTDNPMMLRFYGIATAHYRRTANIATAIDYGERIVAIIDSTASEPSWVGALALSEFGRTLRSSDRERSNRLLQASLAVLSDVFGTEDARVLEIEERLKN